MKRGKSILILMCVALLVTSVGNWMVPVHAATVSKKNLISNVTNPSSGVIQYNLTVPAGKTVNYALTLTPNRRTGNIDRVAGSYTNRTTHTVTKKIKAKVKYLSNKYIIEASYTGGTSKQKITYKDQKSVTSRLKKTVYSSKFTWNAKSIRKWKNGQRLSAVLTFAVTGTVDILVSKGVVSGTVATVIGLSMSIGDFIGSGDVASTKKIATTPIKGWGYRIKCVPYKNGYRQYLIVYNAKGEKTNTYKMLTMPISKISLVIK